MVVNNIIQLLKEWVNSKRYGIKILNPDKKGFLYAMPCNECVSCKKNIKLSHYSRSNSYIIQGPSNYKYEWDVSCGNGDCDYRIQPDNKVIITCDPSYYNDDPIVAKILVKITDTTNGCIYTKEFNGALDVCDVVLDVIIEKNPNNLNCDLEVLAEESGWLNYIGTIPFYLIDTIEFGIKEHSVEQPYTTYITSNTQAIFNSICDFVNKTIDVRITLTLKDGSQVVQTVVKSL